MKLTENTWVPVSLVIVLLMAAMSYGVLYAKVEFLSQQVVEIKTQIAEVRSVLINQNLSLNKQ